MPRGPLASSNILHLLRCPKPWPRPPRPSSTNSVLRTWPISSGPSSTCTITTKPSSAPSRKRSSLGSRSSNPRSSPTCCGPWPAWTTAMRGSSLPCPNSPCTWRMSSRSRSSVTSFGHLESCKLMIRPCLRLCLIRHVPVSIPPTSSPKASPTSPGLWLPWVIMTPSFSNWFRAKAFIASTSLMSRRCLICSGHLRPLATATTS
mmetsp:Transcript_32058/g.58326  ORF Transcript_32058/g.58326 Transcript_32058/m.58326 type:complete len:204 (+) Transcript_32058:1055-1666(+)